MAMTASKGSLGIVTTPAGAGVPAREAGLGEKVKPPRRSVTLEPACIWEAAMTLVIIP